MKKAALVLIIVFILAFSTACGGGMTSPPPPPPPPPVTVSANVAVTPNPTSTPFDLAMSTSFQPAEWDYQFFQNVPSAITPLANLNPSHIRLQGISQGVPQTSQASWDFTVLDAVTQPVLGVGDHSPEFQVAKAPAFMYTHNDADSFHDTFLDTSYGPFAAYAADLVRYYNTGGFTSSDNMSHVSPAYPTNKITWWGIYNEPSINNFTSQITDAANAADYTAMYNVVVPAMQAADPGGNQKFVALEMCCGSEDWVPVFASNVTQQVDAIATHYYSSCNQKDTDSQLMATVPGFASSVQTIYSHLQNSGNPLVMNAPVWITENNVNADFNAGNNMSACNPGQAFVTDLRGSSAFFVAWRPYVFSQVGKAGARFLYHWDFDADPQFGEVNWPGGNTFQLQLSYWVDYWLARYFPAGTSQKLLNSTNSNGTQIEVLPVMNTDGSVVIMISNHAVASATDNNGEGLTANVTLDTSGLGAFTSATKLVFDSTTSATTGPTAASISPASPINLTMNGYSSAFVKLVP